MNKRQEKKNLPEEVARLKKELLFYKATDKRISCPEPSAFGKLQQSMTVNGEKFILEPEEIIEKTKTAFKDSLQLAITEGRFDKYLNVDINPEDKSIQITVSMKFGKGGLRAKSYKEGQTREFLPGEIEQMIEFLIEGDVD